jgi:hypothetical protein
MVWLVKMLKEQMKDTQAAAICQQPQDMQGKSLAMMTDQDFHCRKLLSVKEINQINEVDPSSINAN